VRLSVLAVLLLLLFSSFVSSPVFAQSDPPPDIPIDQWLQGPDRHDFRWKVRLSKPRLTYRQRQQVQIGVAFDLRDLLKAQISLQDLHVVVKLAGKDGHWLGQSYGRFEPPAGVESAAELYGVVNVYVRPGTYRVAAMAYDSLHRRGNLWRGTLRVSPVRNDPLPDAESNLSDVEFQPEPPNKPNSIARLSPIRPPKLVDDPLDLGEGELFLPVDNVRPLQVDVFVNLSRGEVVGQYVSSDPDFPGYDYVMPNPVGPPAMFKIAHVLSQLHLRSGCVRLSAVDILRQQWIVDRKDVKELDWREMRRQVELNYSGDLLAGGGRVLALVGTKNQLPPVTGAKTDARTLAGERQTPARLAQYLEQLETESSPCATGDDAPLHILVVVSDSFAFPDEIQVSPVDRSRFPEGRVFHLRALPDGGATWDQIGSILKPLGPVRLDFHSATQFRVAVAHLIVDLEQASKNLPLPSSVSVGSARQSAEK